MIKHEMCQHTNAMNIFIDTTMVDTWQIIVDDVHDIANVKTTSGDGGCDEDRTFSCTEGSANMDQLHVIECVL